ncbi:MAG: addiction module antitoxin [Acidobacteriota bacterium]|nr:addiction module antitoxin [Acidobacteriota bacterium]
MQRKLTITLDEEVYDGLWRRVGKRRISNFIETVIRPLVADTSLDAGYKAMAADREREAAAVEWSNALIVDAANETR